MPPPATVLEPIWIEPFPDDWLAPSSSDPQARYDGYESITIAFLVALQALPPHQRSVLIFKDVLDWSMAEISEMLDVTVSSATSHFTQADQSLFVSFPYSNVK